MAKADTFIHLFSKMVDWCLKFAKTSRQQNAILSSIINVIETKRNTFVNYTERPVFLRDLNYSSLNDSFDCSRLGIVLQGPIKYEKDFTLESIRIYKKLFKGVSIVVSTWETESSDYIKILKKEGVYVVLSPLPEKSGIGNINYQVISTLAGLKKLKEIGCQYSMKTRTDQRLYRIDLFPYLLSLLESYDIEDIFNIKCQKGRICFCEGSMPSNILLPFHICDFWFFGYTDDLINYFNCPMSMHNKSDVVDNQNFKKLVDNVSTAKRHSIIAPEVILPTQYLKSNGYNVDAESLEQSWIFVTSYLIPVSFDELNLFWFKYFENYNQSLMRTEYISGNEVHYSTYNQTWSFRNWLSIRCGYIKITDKMISFGKQKYEYYI